MLQPKTHFEQVPLEIVRKIVEEQIQREAMTEQTQGTKKKTLEEDLLAYRPVLRRTKGRAEIVGNSI
jgi:hypothetical protein